MFKKTPESLRLTLRALARLVLATGPGRAARAVAAEPRAPPAR